ncbi:MAG: AAA family ATPase [Muribaculaceae bacterium]
MNKKEPYTQAEAVQIKTHDKERYDSLFGYMNFPYCYTDEEIQHDMKSKEGANVGLLCIKSANNVMTQPCDTPKPSPLWKNLWHKNELCCLFSDSNLGKSIYATQIANEIAKKEPVLYFDFELTDGQFKDRYTDHNTGRPCTFSNNLYRVTNRNDYRYMEPYRNLLIDNIKDAADRTGAKVIIIDNLAFLSNSSHHAPSPIKIMRQLISFKHLYNLSILVVAHTPKRNLSTPLTQNNLAGTKDLLNFFDSAFAIGQSAKDENVRYIKQIKSRQGIITNGIDNVITCTISKERGMLTFTPTGTTDEHTLLAPYSPTQHATLIAQAKQLHHDGISNRQIAITLGISEGIIRKWLKPQPNTKN